MTIQIDLSTHAGGRWALAAVVQQQGGKAGMSRQVTNRVILDMHAGDYRNMLKVMETEFPGLFTFLNDPRCAVHERQRTVDTYGEYVRTVKRGSTIVLQSRSSPKEDHWVDVWDTDERSNDYAYTESKHRAHALQDQMERLAPGRGAPHV